MYDNVIRRRTGRGAASDGNLTLQSREDNLRTDFSSRQKLPLHVRGSAAPSSSTALDTTSSLGQGMGKKQPKIHFIFRLLHMPASQQAKVPCVTGGTQTEATATSKVASLPDEVSLFLYVSLSKLMYLSLLGTSS